MSGLAALVHWGQASPPHADLAHMGARMAHRGPDGLTACHTALGSLAKATLALHRGPDADLRPYEAPDLALVADARLTNLRDLAQDLGLEGTPRPGTQAVLAEAYRRWGPALTDRLEGDYAFVVLDLRRRTVFAARDPFGAKPLFYRQERDRLLFASEPKQILGLPGVPLEPDETVVGEFLFLRFEDLSRTYFRGISRLPPGHRLAASPEGLATESHWRPGLEEVRSYRDEQAYFDRFRELLKRAVHARLDTDFPVGCHLSGGLDSGSIVALAGVLAREAPATLPRVETLSACYRQPACDETEAILAMARASGLPNHRFDAEDRPLLEDLEEMFWRTDGPFADVGQGTFLETVRVMKGLGARTLLMGFGGDELLDEGHYLYDLAKRLRWARVLGDVREIRRLDASHWSAARILRECLRHALPERIKEAARFLRPSRPWDPGPPFQPEFVSAFRSLPAVAASGPDAFASRVQWMTWRDLTHPLNTHLMEFYDAKGAWEGHEVGLPFFDRPLAEFVLSLPFEVRVAGPKWKALVRRGLADLLPPEVVRQRKKIALNDYVLACFRREAPALRARLAGGGPWLSGAFIDRPALLEGLDAPLAEAGPDDPAYAPYSVEGLWRPACLELWLRTLPRYRMGTDIPDPFRGGP